MTKLITVQDLEQRFQNVKKSLELIYDLEFPIRKEKLDINNLIPTQPFLEKEKLKRVIKKSINENYYVPIIAMEHRGEFYIIDGHHRTYTSFILGKKEIDAIIMKFPDNKQYRILEKIKIGDMRIKLFKKKGAVVETEVESIEIIKMWEKAGKTVLNFEKMHDIEFTIVNKKIPVKSLIPTQKFADVSKTEKFLNKDVPIICIEHDGKFYVVDGHNRAFVAKKENLSEINSLILVPERSVDFGIVKTAEKWGLRSLDDLIPK